MSAPESKGRTFVSDKVSATDAILAIRLGRKLRERGICYHRNPSDRDHFAGTDEIGVYDHWQKSVMTDDPDEAEAIARPHGLKVEWGPDRFMKTRCYRSAFKYFEPLDRNLLFNSIADEGVWFDSWPKAMQLPCEKRPLELTFADPGELRGVSTVRRRLRSFRHPDPMAHGRPGIHPADGESRGLGVLIGQSFGRQGALPGRRQADGYPDHLGGTEFADHT